MKKFLRKFFWVYFLPVFLYFLGIYVLDPLKCFRTYDDYYTHSLVSPNRENVCINLFEQYDSAKYVNSFILGNSCSHAYHVPNWVPYLPAGAKGFHLDAYRENLVGIQKKLEYLEKKGNKISNALIIIDRSTFSKKFSSFMYVMPKKINDTSNEFYIEHLKALTSIKFVSGYFYYYLFGKNLEFMKEYHFSQHHDICNNATADLTYLSEIETQKDTAAAFKALAKEKWMDRSQVSNLIGNEAFEGLTPENIARLNKIKEILARNNCNYKIIINPSYSQLKMPEDELAVLQHVFGKSAVYDFSGVNSITDNFRNFYDGIHYRPSVANEIMAKVYADPNADTSRN